MVVFLWSLNNGENDESDGENMVWNGGYGVLEVDIS